MPVDLEKMCRTCLAVDTAMLSIFDSHKSAAKDEKSSSLAAMLNTFSAAAISETDGLPKHVCLPCISEINRVYLFKIKCDNSQNTLKKYLEKLSSASDDVESDDDVIIVQDMKMDCDDEVLLFEAPIDVKEKENDLNTNGGEGIVHDNDILVTDEKSPECTDNQSFETNQNQNYNDESQSFETNQQYNEQFPNCTKNSQITAESSEPIKDSLKCPLCLTSFSEKRSFLRHVLGRHSTDLPVTLVEAILCNMNDDETEDIQQQPETEFLEENFAQLVSVDYDVAPDEFTDITEYGRTEQYSFDEMTDENADQPGVFACYVCSQKFESNHECDAHSQLCQANQKEQIAWTSYEYRLEIDSGAMDKDDEDNTELEKNYSKNETNVDKPKIGNGNLKADLDVNKKKSTTLQKGGSSFMVKLDKNLRKKLECSTCKKIFISEQSLASHLDSHEKTNSNQKRSVKNEQQTEQKENMDTKSAKQNNVELKKQCPICKKEFQKIQSLKGHILTHNAKGPLECPVCGKCLSSRRNRNNHLILHATAGFKCGRCRRSFISEKELILHMTKHPGITKYVCSTCGCIFTNRKVLRKHNQIHKKETPHVCKICSMRFKALGSLTIHLRTHEGEKPYRCQYCDRGFARNFDYVKHVKTHSKKHHDICSLCGLSFSEPGAILKHFESNHPGVAQVSPENDNGHSKAGQT